MKPPPTLDVPVLSIHYDELRLFPVLVLESGELFEKDEFDAAGGAVALLADDDLGYVLFFGFGL